MIEVLNRQRRYRVNLKKARALVETLVARYRPAGRDVTLAFVDTRTIVDLNRRFLKRRGATDVLSFPAEGLGAEGRDHLGDIIICVPQAFRQCYRETLGLETELHDLIIHGFLHLAGFDHGRGIEAEEVALRREFVED